MSSSQIKNRVRNQFNRASLTYDRNCSVQNAICLQAIYMLLEYRSIFNNIADLACGTGESTYLLTKNLDYKYCYGVDFAEALLAVASNKLSHLKRVKWMHRDYEQPIEFVKPLDLIFCNMGLQWSDDLNKTLSLWKTYLVDEGVLLLTMPMANNFPELRRKVRAKLLTDSEITDILELNELNMIQKTTKTFVVNFTSQIAALKSLKATGANYNKSIPDPCQGLKSLKIDEVFIDSKVNHLTYEIGIYLLSKKL